MMPLERRGLLYWIFATLLVLIWLLPVFASVLTSLKSLDELNRGLYWTWPEQLLLSNYVEAWNAGFAGYFWNSVLVTIPSLVLILALSSLNGYVLAQIEFPGRTALLFLFVAGMLLPFQILLIPVFYLSSHVLHTYDTRLGLILFHTAFQLGFGSFFMRNFIVTLPKTMIEAARLDGCSETRIYFRIVLPLMKPALAALSTLLFTWIWNDFLWALVLIQSDELKPVTFGLQNLKGQWVSSYQLQSAGALLAAIPPVLVFIVLQKHFIKGLTMGASK
jgi:multiple sugar transport system permease protein